MRDELFEIVERYLADPRNHQNPSYRTDFMKALKNRQDDPNSPEAVRKRAAELTTRLEQLSRSPDFTGSAARE